MKYSVSSSVLALLATTMTVVSSHNRDAAQPTKTNRRRHLRTTAEYGTGTAEPHGGGAVEPHGNGGGNEYEPYGGGAVEPGPDTRAMLVRPAMPAGPAVEPGHDTPSLRAAPVHPQPAVEPGRNPVDDATQMLVKVF